METHTLTTEQLRKFNDAVGGAFNPERVGGQFTTRRLRVMTKSSGGLRDWPSITDDPKVNFAVDCVVDNSGEEDEAGYDETLYTEEVEAWRDHGAFS